VSKQNGGLDPPKRGCGSVIAAPCAPSRTDFALLEACGPERNRFTELIRLSL